MKGFEPRHHIFDEATKMKKEINPGLVIGKYRIFVLPKSWQFGSYNIGDCKVLQRGPFRIFVN